ncbi:MAG: PIG-L family deacetylase [Planctomycetes bacterium]|nr:PIG-L family deacetylase [Planctomycetota bacterium]
MDQALRVFRRDGECADLAAAFAPWAAAEHWLFLSPHDDDVLIGAGLWIQALLARGAAVTVAIVTDGRMGYTDPAERDTIVARRRAEADRAYQSIGLPPDALSHLGFPDGSLSRHSGSSLEEGKAVGLDCALTALMREQQPTRIVTTDATDWHPDHRATFEAARMSLFHACGNIWSELGKPLDVQPSLYAFAVYAPLAAAPDFLIEATETPTARKLQALREFSSQAAIIERLAHSARQEYLRQVPTSPFDACTYRGLFPS